MRLRYRRNGIERTVEIDDRLNGYTVADLVCALTDGAEGAEGAEGTEGVEDAEGAEGDVSPPDTSADRPMEADSTLNNTRNTLEPDSRSLGVSIDGRWHGPETPLTSVALWEGSRIEVSTASSHENQSRSEQAVFSHRPWNRRPSDRHGRHLTAQAGDFVLAVIGGLGAGVGFIPRSRRHCLVIGRSEGCDLTLGDLALSRCHARLQVIPGERPVISDLGSRNGTAVTGHAVDGPTPLPAAVTVRLGATNLAWRSIVRDVPAAVSAGLGASAGRVPFNRPPRHRPPVTPASLRVPAEPPPKPSTEPLSWAGIALPVVAGLILALVWSPFMAVFAALGPVITIGTWLERRRRATKVHRKACQEVDDQVSRLVAALPAVQAAERHRLVKLMPDPAEIVRRACGPSVRCWERRLCDTDAMRLGIGTTDVAFAPPIEIYGNTDSSRISNTDSGRLSAAPDALAAVKAMGPLRDVPVAVSLMPGEVVGIVGPREVANSVARALVLQAAVLHGPADLAVIGLVSGDDDDWAWMRWLPHTTGTTGGSGELVATEANAMTGVVEAITADESSRARLLVIDGTEPITGRAAPGRTLLAGDRTSGIVLVSDIHDLPSVCTTIVEVEHPAGGLRLIDPRSFAELAPVVAWGITVDTATHAAARLARLDDPEFNAVNANLPQRVSLVDLVGGEITADVIEHRWQQTCDSATLTAPIGADDTGPVVIDFVADGPHMLVGGTTGSGKSELLRSLVAGLAMSADPENVAFVLIDYKGGAAFDRCADLPHVAGIVTDLDDRLAERALICLEAELRQREERLRAAGAEDLLAFRARQQAHRKGHRQRVSGHTATAAEGGQAQRVSGHTATAGRGGRAQGASGHTVTAGRGGHTQGVSGHTATAAGKGRRGQEVFEHTAYTDKSESASEWDPLPRLVVVVDEFATLAADLPDFLDSLVGIAQRGRSLGVHMVLATQRPAGVVTDDIRANTSCRIALRVTDRHDSNDVIGSPEAAALPRRLPGRALARFGPGELTAFQTALVTGTTAPSAGLRVTVVDNRATAPDHQKRQAAVGGVSGVSSDLERVVRGVGGVSGVSSDLERVVRAVGVAHKRCGGRLPRSPWPPPLPDEICPDSLIARAGRDGRAAWLVDEPARQRQYVDGWHPGDGHLVVIGGPTSGTSTTLVSVAADVCRMLGPSELHCYGIDFDSGLLSTLEGLPHCGSVISSTDAERRTRLLRFLDDEIADRRATGKTDTASHGIDTASRGTDTASYSIKPPQIVLFVDDLAGLARCHDPVREPETHRRFARIWSNGSSVGVRVVVSLRRAADLSPELAAAVGVVLVHATFDIGDGLRFGLRSDTSSLVPGRAIRTDNGLEIQVCRPPNGDFVGLIAAIASRQTEAAPDSYTGSLLSDSDTGSTLSDSDAGSSLSDSSIGSLLSDSDAGSSLSDSSIGSSSLDSDAGSSLSDSSAGLSSRLPKTIGALPAVVAAEELPVGAAIDDRRIELRFAMSDLTLEPTGFTLHNGEHGVVLGPSRAGRTAALAAIGAAARKTVAEVIVIDDRPKTDLAARLGVDAVPVESLRRCDSRIIDGNDPVPVGGVPVESFGRCDSGTVDGNDPVSVDTMGLRENDKSSAAVTSPGQDDSRIVQPRRLLLVDDADRVRDTDDKILERIVGARDGRTHIVAALSPDRLRSSYGHWTAELRSCRTGVLYRPGPLDGDLLGVTLPTRLNMVVRPGYGLIVANGSADAGQIALVAHRQ